jgi:hypothetical protein
MTRLAAPAQLSGLLVVLFAVTPTSAAEQPWGTIKGKVVFVGDPPAPEKINVGAGQQACLAAGPIFKDELVVDPKTKGVQWAVVYLVAADGKAKTEIPIHPDLKELKEKQKTLDQPCCTFTPHVVILREGQTLLVKNSASFPHNANVTSPGDGPNSNNQLAAGESKQFAGFEPSISHSEVACNVHPWMKALVYTFKHPYADVTNDKGEFKLEKVPTGKYFLVVDHEKVGFLGGLKREKGVIDGKQIEIKEGDNEFNFELKLPLPKDKD